MSIYETTSNNIFRCWHIINSSNIVLGSSAKLTEDVIVDYPVVIIPRTSEKPRFGYSILVKQYALEKEAYEYWSLLKKNTEQLGSIFDAQPSQITGNIHSVSNPDEPVIGYVSAGSVTSKRIFIGYRDLHPWAYVTPFTECVSSFVSRLHPDSINYYFGLYSAIYMPIDTVFTPNGVYVGIGYSYTSCTDCREQGGTTVKPGYWPF